jgi:23S rRNA pseudouridine1911/1915/1917 synthase
MNVTFLAEDEGTRLDRALAARMPEHSRSFLARLIEEGRVMLDGRPAPRPSIRVAEGQNATIDIPAASPTSAESQEIPLSILFEDSDLVVINWSFILPPATPTARSSTHFCFTCRI